MHAYLNASFSLPQLPRYLAAWLGDVFSRGKTAFFLTGLAASLLMMDRLLLFPELPRLEASPALAGVLSRVILSILELTLAVLLLLLLLFPFVCAGFLCLT